MVPIVLMLKETIAYSRAIKCKACFLSWKCFLFTAAHRIFTLGLFPICCLSQAKRSLFSVSAIVLSLENSDPSSWSDNLHKDRGNSSLRICHIHTHIYIYKCLFILYFYIA